MVFPWLRRVASLLDTHLQAAGLLIPKDALLGEYAINVDHIQALIPAIPEGLGQRLSDLCGDALNPVRQVLADDVDTITRVFLELETLHHSQDTPDCDSETKGSFRTTNCIQQPEVFSVTTMAIGHQDRAHKARVVAKSRQPLAPIPIVIPSSHPAAPTIIISSCGSQNQEATCRVPLQNSAFGNKLTVPMHSCYNESHPPMVIAAALLPLLEDWKWENGHWEAVLPSFQQQARRGMYSKTHAARRRSRRPCTSKN